MSTNLPPVPHRLPVMDQNGFLHPVWSDWFQRVFLRTGGSVALTNDELVQVSTSRIDDLAITPAKIDSAIAGNGLSGAAGSPLSVNVDGTTLEIVSDTLQLKDLSVTTAKLAGSIPFSKLLASEWPSSLGASGYQKFPNGFYLQWGVTGSLLSGTSTAITFPTAFPTACLQVIPCVRDNSAVVTTSTGQWGSGAYSTSQFSLYNQTSVALTFNWFAVGF